MTFLPLHFPHRKNRAMYLLIPPSCFRSKYGRNAQKQKASPDGTMPYARTGLITKIKRIHFSRDILRCNMSQIRPSNVMNETVLILPRGMWARCPVDHRYRHVVDVPRGSVNLSGLLAWHRLPTTFSIISSHLASVCCPKTSVLKTCVHKKGRSHPRVVFPNRRYRCR